MGDHQISDHFLFVRVVRIVGNGTCERFIPDKLVQIGKERKIDWLYCPFCDARISLVEPEQQFIVATSSLTLVMDQAADKQRERETAQFVMGL